MRIIVKIFYIFGIVFFGIGLVYSLSRLVALNGLGDIFEMKEARKAITEIVRDSSDISISYTYQVKGKEYHDNYKMFVDYFMRCNVDTIVIKYNKIFPMISYIDGVPLKIRKQRTGIFISTFFLLFLILIWNLSNKDRWVRTYEKVGNRPWLYPDDKTIKSPFKRIKKRLFH
jgi:hypothetical protein